MQRERAAVDGAGGQFSRLRAFPRAQDFVRLQAKGRAAGRSGTGFDLPHWLRRDVPTVSHHPPLFRAHYQLDTEALVTEAYVAGGAPPV
jgi:hypothetical protein